MHRALLLIVVLTVACSGGEKSKAEEPVQTDVVEQPAEPPPEPEAEEPPDQGDGVPFDEKTHEQQEAYMKLTVKPKMEALFQDFDGEKFAEVKCSTCHGENAKERDFEMPSPDLPKMDFETWEKEEPEMMAFMKEKVVPEMAAMLDQQPFDPETKEGFGCGGCHPSE